MSKLFDDEEALQGPIEAAGVRSIRFHDLRQARGYADHAPVPVRQSGREATSLVDQLPLGARRSRTPAFVLAFEGGIHLPSAGDSGPQLELAFVDQLGPMVLRAFRLADEEGDDLTTVSLEGETVIAALAGEGGASNPVSPLFSRW